MFIIGAGALGTLFGGLLSLSGEDVVFYDRNSDKRERIEEQDGVILAGPQGEILAKAGIASFPLPKENEPVLVCVKAQDTMACAAELAPYLDEDQPVLFIGNGCGWQEQVAEIIPSRHLCFGFTYQAAALLAPGKAAHHGQGATILYAAEKRRAPAASVWLPLLEKAFTVREDTNHRQLLWEKLLINSVINPLTALSDLSNGELPLVKNIVPIMLGLLREGIMVAEKEGCRFSLVRMMDKTVQVCADTAANTSSMRADVQRGKKTEIDFINGYIVKRGQINGIDTPLQARMVAEIKENF